MFRGILRLAALAALLTASTAQATFFSSRAAFDAANPGLPVITFEGIAPVGDFIKPVAANFFPGVRLPTVLPMPATRLLTTAFSLTPRPTRFS